MAASGQVDLHTIARAWYSQFMPMKNPDRRLGKAALVVGVLFILACIVLLILAFVLN